MSGVFAVTAITVGSIALGTIPANAAENPTPITINESNTTTNSFITGTFTSYADYNNGTGTGSCGGNPSAVANLAPVRYEAVFVDPANPSGPSTTALLADTVTGQTDFPFDGTSTSIINFKIQVPMLFNGEKPINSDITIAKINCYTTSGNVALQSIQTVVAPTISHQRSTQTRA